MLKTQLKGRAEPMSGSRYDDIRMSNLANDFKAGKKTVFAEIWANVAPSLTRLMRRGLDRHSADDLLGQACTQLYEKGIPDFDRAKSSFIAWVFRLALNIKLNYLKKERPILFSQLEPELKAAGLEDITELADRTGTDSKTPLDILIDREDEALTQRALELLPGLMQSLTAEEQFAVQSSIYDNKTDSEIGLMLSGNAGDADKVRKMRARALDKLGKFFAKKGIRRVPLK